MKKAILLLTGLALVIVAFALWLLSPYYGTTEAVQKVTALSSKAELYVFIGHSKALLKDTRLRLWAKQLASPFLVPERISDDLLVVHLKDGILSKYDLKGFGPFGAFFVYHGEVYWGRARLRGKTGPYTWKWEGSKFVPLSEAETALLDDTNLKDTNETTKVEGWTETYFNKGQMICQLQDRAIQIYQNNEPKSSGRQRMRVFLRDTGSTNAVETLIDVNWGYQQIGKAEYLHLKQHKGGSPEY